MLTQQEAEILLTELKKCIKKMIFLPTAGNTKVFQVQGVKSSNNYTVSIFRGKKNPKKINYNARITHNNIMLLELHINPTAKHSNPDGNVISGSHWHIYKEGYDTRFAFPATDILNDDFIENTLLFLKKFRVIEIPDISESNAEDRL